MRYISELEPKSVFQYFEQIAHIPHGSKNTRQISNYLVDFAKDHKLKYRQDEMGNVIIWKGGKGKPVIIQGHMDMVCEKEPGCTKDMEKEGLEIYIDGDVLRAKGTTLGGDDGIAVAMALALLDSDDPELPPIEAIITVDEEIGMLGAAAIDLSDVEGRTMLNIDSEEEGIFTVSCAGGAVGEISLAAEREEVTPDTLAYEVEISGLVGGHSGIEIHKNRANAIQLLGRVLQRLRDDVGIRLVDLSGGAKDNAIAVSARAVFTIDESSRNACGGICELCRTQDEGDDIREQMMSLKSGFVDEATSAKMSELAAAQTVDAKTLVKSVIETMKKSIANEYATSDPDISISCKPVDIGKLEFADDAKNMKLDPMTVDCTNKIIYLLCAVPNGVQRMSPDVEGLVQTSLNKGILKSTRVVLPGDMIGEDRVGLALCLRSSVGSEKDMLMRTLRDMADVIGADIRFEGSYPGWKYSVESTLRDTMVDVFTKQFGYAPRVEAIHAGVECGYFADKLPGLDCVSFGPELKEIHTYRESMNIASVGRTYKLVLETLHSLANK